MGVFLRGNAQIFFISGSDVSDAFFAENKRKYEKIVGEGGKKKVSIFVGRIW